jgi:acetyl esterase/lipase
MSPIYSDRMKEFMKFDLGALDLSAYPVEALDVPYMENGKFTYDLYRQDKTKKSPLIIVIHGGGWVGGYKRSKFMGPMIQPAFHGVAVALLSYTLALEAPFPQSVYDVKAAIRYFRANADKLNIDADRLFLWGESAGSNVAALVGLTLNTDLHDLKQGYASVSEDLAGVITHYGVFDLLKMSDHKKALGIVDDWNSSDEDHYMTFWLGKPFDQDPTWTAKANPISYVKNNTIPFYLIHGLADTMVPYLQTQEFVEALCSQGKASVSVDYVVNAEHTDPLTFSPDIITKIVDFTHNAR